MKHSPATVENSPCNRELTDFQVHMVACACRFCYDKAAETYSIAEFVLRRTFLKENKPDHKLTGGQIV